MEARIYLLICVFVNYCYFPDKKEHRGASWQIRWQRETGGVQMRNTEHPKRETRHWLITTQAAPERGLRCPENQLGLTIRECPFLREKKAKRFPVGARRRGPGPGPALRGAAPHRAPLRRPCPCPFRCPCPRRCPLLAAAVPLPSVSLCHPRPSVSPRRGPLSLTAPLSPRCRAGPRLGLPSRPRRCRAAQALWGGSWHFADGNFDFVFGSGWAPCWTRAPGCRGRGRRARAALGSGGFCHPVTSVGVTAALWESSRFNPASECFRDINAPG